MITTANSQNHLKMQFNNLFKAVGAQVYDVLGERGRKFQAKFVTVYNKTILNYKRKIMIKRNVLKFSKTLKELIIKNDIQEIEDHIMGNMPEVGEKDYVSLNQCLNKIEEYLKIVSLPDKITLIKALIRKLPSFYYRIGKSISKQDLNESQILLIKSEILDQTANQDLDIAHNFVISILTSYMANFIKNGNLSTAIQLFNDISQDNFQCMNQTNAKLVHKVLGTFLSIY